MYDHLGVKHHLHSSTNNLSFVNTADSLKRLGVLNYHFPLTLINGRLTDVNPHSPHLSRDVQDAIVVECLTNPWYFLRECVRVPSHKSGAGTPFILDRQSVAKFWCYLNGVNTITVAMRQSGVLVTSAACVLYNLLGSSGSHMFHDWTPRASRVSMRVFQDMYMALPKFLRNRMVSTQLVNFTHTWEQEHESTLGTNAHLGASPSLTMFDCVAVKDFSSVIAEYTKVKNLYLDSGADPKSMTLDLNMNGFEVRDRHTLQLFRLIEKATPFSESVNYDTHPDDLEPDTQLLRFTHTMRGYSDAYITETAKRNMLSTDQVARDYLLDVTCDPKIVASL